MKKNSARKRFWVMLSVLIVVAIGYFSALGIGNVCGIGLGDITLLCPLGSLMAMISARTAIPLAVISIVVVLALCLLLGKVFCSWICPVHFLSKLHRKPKQTNIGQNESVFIDAPTLKASTDCSACAHPCGKSKGIKIDSRHGVLAAALLSTALFGFPVFCLVCPVGLTFATVLLVMRMFAFGETTWTLVLTIAIIVAEVVFLPKWCQKLCPLGALLSLFSAGNRTFRPQVDASTCLVEGEGRTCDLCVKACPENIDLHDIAKGETTLNDCSKCRACADACPTASIAFPFLPAKDGKAIAQNAAADPSPTRKKQ